MHLRHERYPVVRQPVHHVELPQRPGAVQAPRELARHEGRQLGVAPGRRQGGVAHVPRRVEARVVHPHGLGQPAGQALLDALAVARDEVHPRAQALDHGAVLDPGPGVEHQRGAHRHVHRAALGGQ